MMSAALMGDSETRTPTTDDQGFSALVIKEHISAESLQLTLRIGDVVVVVEEDTSGWAGGYKAGDEDVSGWFPRMCVRQMTQQETVIHMGSFEMATPPVPAGSPTKPPGPAASPTKSNGAIDARSTGSGTPVRGRLSGETRQVASLRKSPTHTDTKLLEKLRKVENELSNVQAELAEERQHRRLAPTHTDTKLLEKLRKVESELSNVQAELAEERQQRRLAEVDFQRQLLESRRREGQSARLEELLRGTRRDLERAMSDKHAAEERACMSDDPRKQLEFRVQNLTSELETAKCAIRNSNEQIAKLQSQLEKNETQRMLNAREPQLVRSNSATTGETLLFGSGIISSGARFDPTRPESPDTSCIGSVRAYVEAYEKKRTNQPSERKWSRGPFTQRRSASLPREAESSFNAELNAPMPTWQSSHARSRGPIISTESCSADSERQFGLSPMVRGTLGA